MPKNADIVVTAPKNEALVEEEARQCVKTGYGYFFKTFRHKPEKLRVDSRIFYAENGFIRGFGAVSEIFHSKKGYHAVMRADSWKWIKPIPMKGFQGWRYFKSKKIKITGEWNGSKPSVSQSR